MGNWQQIQARIRKAKTSADPTAQLAALYARTRDAMAAYELAIIQERAGNRDQAVEWYTVAAQRFRRAEWKKKAEEALERLGAPVPAAPERGAAPETAASDESPASPAATPEPRADDFNLVAQDSEPTLFDSRELEAPEHQEITAPPSDVQPKPAEAQAVPGQRRKRRRGRRGGRGRRKSGAAPASAAAGAAPPTATAAGRAAGGDAMPRSAPVATPSAPQPPRDEPPVSFLRDPDSAPHSSSFLTRGRAGDPALSSRLAPLESQLRRLLAAAPSPVEEAPNAPAGPGVFLLSDSDQTTYYYIESCQTLRIGIANLLRTASRGRGPAAQGEPVRARLADHLGIPATKAPKYLKDYCVVRWLQLDEGASHLAHFAIAILRPALNE